MAQDPDSSAGIFDLFYFREIVIVENIRLVHLLDLSADFGLKIKEKLTPMREKNKTGIQSCCLYTVIMAPIFS